jgi:hypothetical protein
MTASTAQEASPPTQRRGSPILLAAAVGLLLLAAAQVVVLGDTPRAADSGAQVVAWLRGHGEAVRWWIWAITVGGPVYGLVIALLCRLLPAPHRDVFLIGGIGLGATNAVQTFFWGGLALHADRLEPATARTLLDVAIYWAPVVTGQTMLMIAPVTLLALRGHAGLPKWLGLLGLVVLLEQAVETVTIFGSTGFTEPGGTMNNTVGPTLFIAWLFAFALWGGLRGRPDAAGA